jgi:hypothetical protein
MSRKVLKSLAAVALAGAAIAFPAPAAASVIIVGSCDSVTDGDPQGCLFGGNITGNPDPTNGNSYKTAEARYNALMDPDITLNFLTDTDNANFSDFGSIVVDPGGLTGTFDLSGFTIEFFAVKYSNRFTLYEYLGTDGTGSWATNGTNAMSHIVFFGTPGAVPEPATWAMMLLGFGAVGSAMRRSRRRGALLTQIA